MKFLAILLASATVCLAKPTAKSYASAFGYGYNPLAVGAPLVNPSNQFHAQDELGQYNYGYQGPTSAKQEVRTADGVVKGSYSYIDANGVTQRVDYISDILGFRVAASNLPQAPAAAPVAPAVPVGAATAVQDETVVQAEAPIAYSQATVQAVPATKVVAAVPTVHSRPLVMAPTVAYTYLPYAPNYNYYFTPGVQHGQANLAVPVSQPIATAPVAKAAVPVAVASNTADVVEVGTTAQVAPAVIPVAAPVVPIQSQYHAQDELGQYNFGYQEPNSNRQEVKTADGVVRGSYNYVDDTGKIQTVEYIADAGGFRVAGTTIPVQEIPAAPVSVAESPDVVAARQEHNRLYAQVVARNEEAAAEVLAKQAEIAAAQTTYDAVQPAPAAHVAPVAPAAHVAPVAPAAHVAPVAPAPYVAPVATPSVQVVPAVAPPVSVSSQYHAQDELGQYNYGYSTDNSAKQEIRTADGSVRGAYRYIDADGKLQSVEYISDALGFRVAATNLPKHEIGDAVVAADAPAVEVAAAPSVVVQAKSATVPVAAAPAPAPGYVIAPKMTSFIHLPYATGYRYLQPPGSFAKPVAVAAEPAPVVEKVAAPAASFNAVPAVPGAPSSQFQAQDEAGQYNYGYSSPLSSKQETKTSDGVVRGSYSYIDANGVQQRVDYISDVLGFRVAASNLPGTSPMAAKVANYAYLPYAFNHPYYNYNQEQ